MGHREVKRVPLDFDWPRGSVWDGYRTPARLHANDCPDCEHGYSPFAEHLYGVWYGKLPFDPATTGSTLLTPETPAVPARRRYNPARSFPHRLRVPRASSSLPRGARAIHLHAFLRESAARSLPGAITPASARQSLVLKARSACLQKMPGRPRPRARARHREAQILRLGMRPCAVRKPETRRHAPSASIFSLPFLNAQAAASPICAHAAAKAVE